MQKKFRLFCGGFGSGKTYAVCFAICSHFLEHPGIPYAYFAPTYSLIRNVFFPTIEEVCELFGMSVDIKLGNSEVVFYIGKQYRGTCICRSLDNPNNIIGFRVGGAAVDELDTLTSSKAQTAWRKIIARLRVQEPGLRNGVDISTTPEGYRFCHKLFVADVQENPSLSENYGMVKASTYENENHLPDGYIASLEETYTKELVQAYVLGNFCNLTSGTVYRQYSRERCNSLETIKPPVMDGGRMVGEPLFVGLDFNVQHMAATIYVQRPNGWHAVAELKNIFDTPDMIKIINERWVAKGHRIVVYPDASAKGRETVDASKSDIALLEQARYTVRVNASNPSVKDRINSVNAGFEKGRLWVNAKACPTTAKCLEGQVYTDDGEPDKASGFDHTNDAFGYAYAYEHPIIHDRVVRVTVGGI